MTISLFVLLETRNLKELTEATCRPVPYSLNGLGLADGLVPGVAVGLAIGVAVGMAVGAGKGVVPGVESLPRLLATSVGVASLQKPLIVINKGSAANRAKCMEMQQ
jgi:hypothetical protein